MQASECHFPRLLGSHHRAAKVQMGFAKIELSSSTVASSSDLSLDWRSSEDGDLAEKCYASIGDLAEKCYASIGSCLHATGKCRPCGWFWKPEGCKNGANCCHCHLCPEGEIKSRKRAKAIAMMQSSHRCEVPSYTISLSESLAWLQGENEPQPPLGAPASPSIGSKLHETGQCRPCAWLYKPGGCRNGSQCGHCHLCPEGEIKARKREKVASMLRQSPIDSEACFETDLHQDQASDVTEATQTAEANLAPTLLISRGSALHEAGICKPCGWFWKIGGCKNGKDCDHCHSCPKDSIKARKRAKAQAMATLGASSLTMEMCALS